jgi:CubicO group peptidase (beta-lactamase class C family)
MSRPRVAVAAVLLLFGLGRAPAARAQEDPLKGLDEYITQQIKDWEVPGLALAIVKDDKVVLARGYGVRKLGEEAPVTEHTLFAIGSNTKAFTVAALGMLVDEGKLKWDDPVTKHLPSFQLKDPFVTRALTLRDLLAHRTGLDRLEMVWYGAPIGRDEVLRRLRHAKEVKDFRSKFTYQNMMYLAAGQAIPAVTGTSWDDFIAQRIFKPLGMTSSNTSVTALARSRDVATPHQKVDDKVETVPWRNLDNVGPCGSINSSARDMAQWVRLQLGEGTFNKKRLLSSGAVKEMHTPQMVMRFEGTMAKLNPHTHFMTYGLGWMLTDYRGVKVVEHGGGIDGMISLVAFVPEKKLGLVVLTNHAPNLLPTALKYRILDAYLGAPPRDWSADLLKMMKDGLKLAKEAEKKQEKERVKGTKPSLALEKYAGTYRDDLYGEVQIVKEKDKLVLRYGPAFVGDLEHWHYDTFRATWNARHLPKAFVTFRLDEKAKVEEVKVAATGLGDLTLKRAPDRGAKTPAITLSKEELRKFVGKYECKSPPVDVSVELVGDKLKVVGPAGSRTAVPVKPTRFRLEGLSFEVFVDFEVVDGKVKGMTLSGADMPSLKLVPKK